MSLEDCFLLCINEIFPTSASGQELLIFFEKYFISVVLRKIGITSHWLIRNSKSSSLSSYVYIYIYINTYIYILASSLVETRS